MSGDVIMINKAKYKDPKDIKDINKYFYFTGISPTDNLVELIDSTRTKVARLPGFVMKLTNQLVRRAPKISVDVSNKGINNPLFVYNGARQLYRTRDIYTKRLKPKWLDVPCSHDYNGDYSDYRSSKGLVLGNHADVFEVYHDGNKVCTYAVVSRTMADNHTELSFEYIKSPERSTVIHLWGDEYYLPINYSRVKTTLPDNLWLCDGYFFTKGVLYIEPIQCIKSVTLHEIRGDTWIYTFQDGSKFTSKVELEENRLMESRSPSSIYRKYEGV